MLNEYEQMAYSFSFGRLAEIFCGLEDAFSYVNFREKGNVFFCVNAFRQKVSAPLIGASRLPNSQSLCKRAQSNVLDLDF